MICIHTQLSLANIVKSWWIIVFSFILHLWLIKNKIFQYEHYNSCWYDEWCEHVYVLLTKVMGVNDERFLGDLCGSHISCDNWKLKITRTPCLFQVSHKFHYEHGDLYGKINQLDLAQPTTTSLMYHFQPLVFQMLLLVVFPSSTGPHLILFFLHYPTFFKLIFYMVI